VYLSPIGADVHRRRSYEPGDTAALRSKREEHADLAGAPSPRDDPHRHHRTSPPRHRPASPTLPQPPLRRNRIRPLTLAGAVLLAAVMVTLATVLPARRAAPIEPMQALRTE